MMRKKISKKRNIKTWKKGLGVKGKNLVRPMRGGYRI